MLEVPIAEKVALVLPFLETAMMLEMPLSPDDERRVWQLVDAVGDRLKVAGDILDFDEFFATDADLDFDQKAFDKRIRNKEGAAELLKEFRQQLAAVEVFDVANLDRVMHEFVDAKEIKIGEIIHAIRVAVSGKAKGIGMFDCLAILGRESCLARIDRALGLL